MLFFAGPTIGIIASIFLFATVAFIVNVNPSLQGGALQVLTNTLVFLVGAFCVMALPIGIILGFIGLSRNSKARSGSRPIERNAENTLEASRGWNWGAFFLTWIWGLSNGVTQSLWALVPIWGFIYSFVLGAKGNQWAWEGREWDSIEQFRASQRKWAIWGFVTFVVIFLFYLLIAASGGDSGASY